LLGALERKLYDQLKNEKTGGVGESEVGAKRVSLSLDDNVHAESDCRKAGKSDIRKDNTPTIHLGRPRGGEKEALGRGGEEEIVGGKEKKNEKGVQKRNQTCHDYKCSQN